VWCNLFGGFREGFRGRDDLVVSHLNLKTNPDASHMCDRIKFHTYGDLVYRK
jgi:hypothetical protein